MAKPRVFDLELFIESAGHDPVLSEKGDIAYMPDIALDESCYREAGACDIFVLVVGGRYGSEVSAGDPKAQREAFERYDSITRKEYDTAYNQDVPIFVLIESSVYAEYRTYLKNRDNKDIRYAHVDSINVFRFIEFILGKPRNSPVFAFERSSQIETWLREQWSGLFRELLRSRSQQRQLFALTEQVTELKTANETLKNYLEALLKGISPKDSSQIIAHEQARVIESMRLEKVRRNGWFRYMRLRSSADPEGLPDGGRDDRTNVTEEMLIDPQSSPHFGDFDVA
jgi:Domain of unknown function (DUF4062)